MDTAGKAVLFSGLTVLISLSAVMLVPSPAFRSVALGIMVSVLFVLAATLTLLPAVLAKLGPRVDKLALPWAHSGEHRSPRFARWGELLWRRPLLFGGLALVALLALALPVLGLKTGMPSIKVVPEGDSLAGRLRADQRRLRPGRARARCRSTAPRARGASRSPRVLRRRSRHRRGAAAADRAPAALALIEAVPDRRPLDRRPRRHGRPPARRAARRRRWSAARRPKTTTSRRRWRRRRRW